MKPKSREEAARTAGSKAREFMKKYGSCAQSTVLALQETFGMEDDNLFKAAGSMTGGVGGMHDACGSLVGAGLVFGAATGRGVKDYADKEKIKESMTLTAQLLKWYEKEFGSATCKEIRTRFGGGVYYDVGIPWQAELAKQAGVGDKCAELAGRTAEKAAEMLWDALA